MGQFIGHAGGFFILAAFLPTQRLVQPMICPSLELPHLVFYYGAVYEAVKPTAAHVCFIGVAAEFMFEAGF